jgi:hypothetical protein
MSAQAHLFAAKNQAGNFVIVTWDPTVTKILRTAGPFTEAQLRSEFKEAGMPEMEIDQKVSAAKKCAFHG